MSKSDLREYRNTVHGAVNFVQAGEGAPVIMLHGLAASLHDWDELFPALVSQGYSGYALDLLGHGESLKPERPEAYTSESVYEHMSAWIRSLALEEPAVLIGHSLGGYLALKFALQNPGQIRALILVNPFYSLNQLPALMRIFLRRPLVHTNLIGLAPYWLFRFLVDVTSLELGNSNEKWHTIPESVRVQTALDYKRAAPGIYNIPRTLRDLTPDLPHIHHPTLVVWGARDQTINPKTFQTLVEKLPNARREIMPTCGHVPHQCHASDFNQKVLEFIRQSEN